MVQVLDTATTTRWLSNPAPKTGVLEKGLVYLYPSAWRTVKQLVSLIPLEGYNLQRILVGMGIFMRLSIVPTAELDTIRMVLACIVMATAVELKKTTLSPERAKDYANTALKFIVCPSVPARTDGEGPGTPLFCHARRGVLDARTVA